MLRLISGALAFLFLLSSCECKSGNRFFDLCEKVAHSQSEPLNKEELEEFKHFAEAASFQTLVAAARRIDWCPYDSIPSSYYEQKTQGLDPELPWDAPTKILAEQTVLKRPHANSIHRLIFHTSGGGRPSEYLIKLIGKHHPELACELIELHYQKTFEVAGNDALFNDYDALADRLFYNMAKRPDGIARQLLLKKRFENIPLSDHIERHALYGVYRAAETSQDLIDFLDWKVGPVVHLDDRLEYWGSPTRGSFTLCFKPSITRLALTHLAHLDPEKAIAWATFNQQKLSFDWPFAIFAGWVDFPLHKSSALEVEWPRALDWLAETQLPESKAFKYINLPQILNWLNEPGKNQRIEDTKAQLRVFMKEKQPFRKR